MTVMKLRRRRFAMVIAALIAAALWIVMNPASYEEIFLPVENTGAENGILSNETDTEMPLAMELLDKLEVKGRAPKKGYTREQFYDGWPDVDGCSLRQRIIKREFGLSAVLDGCNVIKGEFDEPYTGEHMVFEDKVAIQTLQIDHVVALSDAWQKGAQQLDYDTRYRLATDPMNLLAVEGEANKQKSDGDAATWLPKNKAFRCQYVARQVSVKYKYNLWVTEAEKNAIIKVLEKCPNERGIIAL